MRPISEAMPKAPRASRRRPRLYWPLRFNSGRLSRTGWRVRSALLLVYSGRYGEAVSMWRQIVKEEPTETTGSCSAEPHVARHCSKKRDALKKYVEMQPADPVGHSELGLVTLSCRPEGCSGDTEY